MGIKNSTCRFQHDEARCEFDGSQAHDSKVVWDASFSSSATMISACSAPQIHSITSGPAVEMWCHGVPKYVFKAVRQSPNSANRVLTNANGGRTDTERD